MPTGIGVMDCLAVITITGILESDADADAARRSAELPTAHDRHHDRAG
jgi:hypothetical protein